MMTRVQSKVHVRYKVTRVQTDRLYVSSNCRMPLFHALENRRTLTRRCLVFMWLYYTTQLLLQGILWLFPAIVACHYSAWKDTHSHASALCLCGYTTAVTARDSLILNLCTWKGLLIFHLAMGDGSVWGVNLVPWIDLSHTGKRTWNLRLGSLAFTDLQWRGIARPIWVTTIYSPKKQQACISGANLTSLTFNPLSDVWSDHRQHGVTWLHAWG